MRKSFIAMIVPLVAMLSSCNSPAGTTLQVETEAIQLSAADRDEIMSTFLKTKDAWNEGDLEGFMSGYWRSDSIAFVGSAGPVYGFDATLEGYKKGYPGPEEMGLLDFEVLRLYRIDTRTAIMIGKFYLTRTIGDAWGYYTLVWQIKNGRWVIVSDHSSAARDN